MIAQIPSVAVTVLVGRYVQLNPIGPLVNGGYGAISERVSSSPGSEQQWNQHSALNTSLAFLSLFIEGPEQQSSRSCGYDASWDW